MARAREFTDNVILESQETGDKIIHKLIRLKTEGL